MAGQLILRPKVSVGHRMSMRKIPVKGGESLNCYEVIIFQC